MIDFATPIVDRKPIVANPAGLWTLASEFVSGGVFLKVVSVEGKWSYSATAQCGPDGDARSLIARSKTIFPDAPVGALIGKIGGSSAGVNDGEIFLAGSFGIFKVSGAGGPLYFTINDEYTGMANNAGSVIVSAWASAPLAVDTAAPAAAPANPANPAAPPAAAAAPPA